MDEQLESYLLSTIDKPSDWVKELEAYAKENNIPIMEPLGMEFLMQMVRIKKPKKILEIGTAIGYSALRMLSAYPETKIVTIERGEARFQQASENISSIGKQDSIHIEFGDALEIQDKIVEKGPFDMLFIDAAKGHYQQFFELYSQMLTIDGIIISDNVLFRGIVAKDNTENKRLSKIAAKLRHYNEWLINHPTYKTTIAPIGDGIAISVKR